MACGEVLEKIYFFSLILVSLTVVSATILSGVLLFFV